MNTTSTTEDRTPRLHSTGIGHAYECPCIECEEADAPPTPAQALDSIEARLLEAGEILAVIHTEGRTSPKMTKLLREALDTAHMFSAFLLEETDA